MRSTCVGVAAVAIALAGAAGCGWLQPREPIKVGVLHSITGTMSVSEKSVIDATLLAIDELNERGGLLGRPVAAVVADGRSEGPTFAAAAERLIANEQVCAVFGCWTSEGRKTVLPVFERHNQLLFYPLQHEGLEQSTNIIYLGGVPNQQIAPAIAWSLRELHARRFFLVGSDYVFPRTAHAIIRGEVERGGGQVVGEEFVRLGTMEFTGIVQRIVEAKPDLIVNCLNGDGNIGFFDNLRAAGITPATLPTLSFSIAEDELRSMDADQMAGDYCGWNYFQSVDTAANRDFVARFKARYGRSRVTDDPMAAAYGGVHLWALAVEKAHATDPAAVRAALAGLTYAAPEGAVTISPANGHAWKTARIGRVRADGQFDVVWASQAPIAPEPYPEGRSPAEWDAFLSALYNGWGGRWANPGPAAAAPGGAP